MNTFRNFLKPSDIVDKPRASRQRRQSEVIAKKKNSLFNNEEDLIDRLRRFSVPDTSPTIVEINGLDTINEVSSK
jgi:hypothetical protein